MKNNVNISICTIDKENVVLIQFEKSSDMGAIGVAEGKRITFAFDYATKMELPVVAVVSSCGMRVQEGTLALMQMAKIILALKQHSDKGLLYIAIVIGHALGGASASLVSLADIIIAESTSLYGFTGKRIIEQTIHQKLSDNFQTAEYAKQYDMVDIVTNKNEIKGVLTKLLQLHSGRITNEK